MGVPDARTPEKKMLSKTKSVAFGTLATLSVFALAAQAGVTLARKPKVNDEFKYTLKANIDFNGQPVELSGVETEKVTEVAADGTYTMESKMADLKISMNGQEFPAPDTGSATVIVYNANGTVKDIRGDETGAETYRFANLSVFLAPGKEVKVGDSWTNDGKGDTKTGAVAYKTTYKIVGEEKIGAYDTYKIEFNAKESEGATPASSDGTIFVDKTDGSLVKSVRKVTNAPFPGAPAPLSGSFTITRQ